MSTDIYENYTDAAGWPYRWWLNKSLLFIVLFYINLGDCGTADFYIPAKKSALEKTRKKNNKMGEILPKISKTIRQQNKEMYLPKEKYSLVQPGIKQVHLSWQYWTQCSQYVETCASI